jgi:hypothetical protein
MVGLTGLEPVTLRLSSACSNQLSYRPRFPATPLNFRISIADFRIVFLARFVRNYLNRQSTIANRKLLRRHSGHGGDVRLQIFRLVLAGYCGEKGRVTKIV